MGKFTLDGTIAAVAYRGVMRKLLYQLKYQPYLTSLIPDLTALCAEALVQNEVFTTVLRTSSVFVPIPLSPQRLRKRGYNQAALLAKALGETFGVEVVPLLKRVKETKPQYGLKREERMENMQGAFSFVIPAKAGIDTNKGFGFPIRSGMTGILVDDVLTTGSTMQEAAKVLKKQGFQEVWGLALAKD